MTEELILTEESVASEEQAVSDEPVTAKKAYVTPQMEIEYFDVEDIITTSGTNENLDNQVIPDDYELGDLQDND